MKLTDTQRRQIQRGIWPYLEITEDEAKSLEPHAVKITEQLDIWVSGARKEKKGGWYAEYTVRDNRPRFMKRTPGMDDEYTSSLAQAVCNEDTEAVSKEVLDEFTEQARRRQDEFNRQNRAEELARHDRQRLNSEIKELTKRAIKMGIDPAVALAPIYKAVEQQHSGLKDAA